MSPLPSEFFEYERRVTQAVALVEEVASISADRNGADGMDGVSVTGPS
jgi:hypothetical protein